MFRTKERKFVVSLRSSGNSAHFLRHARCNRNVTLDEEKCAPAYRRTLELAKTVSQAQDVDRGLKRSCCAFSEFVECKNFHVERDCGDRASAFFSRHMQRISGPLIEDHCGHYAHGGSCDDSAASSAHRETEAKRRWPLLLATAIAAMALKSNSRPPQSSNVTARDVSVYVKSPSRQTLVTRCEPHVRVRTRDRLVDNLTAPPALPRSFAQI
ncbi:hypothetical protein MTO96_007942 [Rhipicephalus appendiculatus]